jgi:hypothetical protein
MSWSLDTSTQGTYGITNPQTVSHTCASTAKLLVVTLFVNGNTARTGGAPTYNGTPMTDSGEGFVVHTECGVEVWYLVNPDTGSSYTVSVPNSGALNLDVSVASFIPTSGAGNKDSSNNGTGISVNPSINVVTNVDNCLMIGALGSGDRDAPTAGTNYTIIHTQDAGNQTWGSEYDLDAGTSGTTAVDFATARSDDWGVIGIAFKEATSTSDNQAAYMSGSQDDSDNQPAYTAGGLDVSDNQSAYTAGGISTSDSQPAFIQGQDVSSDSNEAYMAGGVNVADSQAAYVAGGINVADSQAAYVAGSINVSDFQAAYVAGSAVASDSQAAYINGASAGTNVDDNQAAYMAGSTTASDNQPAYINGTASNAIDIQGNEGHIRYVQAAGDGIQAILNAVSTSGVETTLKFRFSNNVAGAALGIHIRASRDWSSLGVPTSGYEVLLDSDGGYDINRISSGSRNLLGSGSWTGDQNAYQIRFQAVGTSVKFRIWQDGGGEPGVWDDEFTTTSEPAGTLQLAVTPTGAGSNVYDIYLDDLSYHVPAGEALSSIEAYVEGQDTASDNQSAYIAGGLDVVDSQSAYIAGTDTAASNQAAYIAGVDTASDNQIAYVAGVDTASDNQPAYVAGGINVSDNQAAYMGADAVASDSQSAYIEGEGGTQSNISAYIAGTDTTGDSQAAYVAGGINVADSQAAYMDALGAVTSSVSAYISGFSANVSSVEAYIKGVDIASDSQAAYLVGGINVSDNQPAFIDGEAATISNVPAYIVGSDTSTDSQPAYIEGQQAASASQQAYIAGVDATGDSQPAYIEGAPDFIFADGFETGDFTNWDADSGFTVTTNAALKDTYGAQADLVDTAFRNVNKNITRESHLRARFYFDPNTLSMTDSTAHYIATVVDDDLAATILWVELLYTIASGFQVRMRHRVDGGGISNTGWYDIDEDVNYIEFDWKASTGPGLDNGYLTLWINGVQQIAITGRDTDELGAQIFRLSASSVDVTTSGIQYFDDVELRRYTYIGGILDRADNQSAYIHGQLATSDNQSAYMAGSIPLASSQEAYIAGQASIASSQAAYIDGEIGTSDSQAAYVVGAASSASSQAAYMAGGVLDTASQPAYIFGSAEGADRAKFKGMWRGMRKRMNY